MSEQEKIAMISRVFQEYIPYIDDSTILDKPIIFSHNGQRGVYHLNPRCGQRGYNSRYTDTSLITIKEASLKRICQRCLNDGIRDQLLNGGRIFEQHKDLIKDIKKNLDILSHSANDLTPIKIMEYFSFREKILKYRSKPDDVEVIAQSSSKMSSEFIRLRKDFLAKLKSVSMLQLPKVEKYIAMQYLSALVENEKYLHATPEQSFALNGRDEVSSYRDEAYKLFGIYVLERSQNKNLEESMEKLNTYLKSVKLVSTSQLKTLPIPEAEDLAKAIEIGWKSHKERTLLTLLERWEAKYDKIVANEKSVIALVSIGDFWRQDIIKYLIPFYQQAQSTNYDLVVLRVPKFIGNFLTLHSDKSGRYNSKAYVELFIDEGYSNSVLETAIALYEPANDSVYSQFQVALNAAAII